MLRRQNPFSMACTCGTSRIGQEIIRTPARVAQPLAGAVGPQLAGAQFVSHWKTKRLAIYSENQNHDAEHAGSLSPDATRTLSRFSRSNGYTAGTTRLAIEAAPLKTVKMADPRVGGRRGGHLLSAVRPALFLREEWEADAANDEHPLSQQSVSNLTLN
jgi:hypothetical protein